MLCSQVCNLFSGQFIPCFNAQGIEDCLKEIETANKVERRAEEGSEDSYGRGWTHRIRRKLWSITEYPESSNSAKVNC